MKKDFIRLSGILCVITLVAALLLAWVNSLTKTKIAEAANKASEEAMQSIMTDAKDFKKVTDTVYECSANGKMIGYCVTVTEKGFGGDIVMMVGIDCEEKVRGIEVLSHSETPGLGAKMTTDDFKKRFCGKNTELSVVKTPTKSPDEVQAITGATITSRAAAKGVSDARLQIEEAKGENK